MNQILVSHLIFSPHKSCHCYGHLYAIYAICILNHFYNEFFTDTTVGLPQTRRDKRQNSQRPRGRRGQNKEQRRQLSDKLPNMEEIAREILPRLTLGNLWEHLVQGRPQQQRLRGRRRPQGMIINKTTNPEITFYPLAECHMPQL